jgi:putative chitinase
MTITPIHLSEILGKNKLGVEFINKKTASLNEVFEKYSINTPLRVCHYLAQILHETGAFVYKEEIWGNTPAQLRYETRADLGNTPEIDGDGKRYKGRGDIQITGRTNYKAISKALGVDFLLKPELLIEEPYCTLCGGWFWHTRNLNRFADTDNLNAVTRRVNGGINGIEDRRKWLLKAKSVLVK